MFKKLSNGLLSILKAFNFAIDVFVLYVLLFGHISGSIFGKAFEMKGLFL